MKDITEIRAHFAKDRFATALGIEIESADESGAVCTARVQPQQTNALGRVQGGFIYTLADFTFAVAANTHRMGTVTLQSNIHYLAAPKGEVLTATARPLSLGGRVAVYEVAVRDENGEVAAMVTATGYTPGKGPGG